MKIPHAHTVNTHSKHWLVAFVLIMICTHSVSAQTYWDTGGNVVTVVKNMLGTTNNYSVKFISNNIERMRLTETGFLGIGTEIPTQLLDVDGQIRLRFGAANYKILSSDANGNATWEFLQLDLTGNNLSVLNHGNAIDLSAYKQTLSLTGTTLSISNGNNVLFDGWDTNASNDFSGNYYDLSNLPTLFDGNYYSLSNLPILFDGNWNSLTGTAPNVSVFNNDADYLTSFTELDGDPTNEFQDLEVIDNQLSLTDSDVSIDLNELNYWSKLNDNLFYNTANVGIGINEPQKLLHIHSDDTFKPGEGLSTVIIKSGPFTNPVPVSSTSSMLFTNVNSGSTANDGLIIRLYNNNAIIYLQETGSLTLLTKNKLSFKMQENGNVSIGDLNTNFFTVKENGNVGIGTDEPVASLHVKGNKIIVERNQKYIHINASNPNAEIGSSTGEIKFWYTDGVGYNNVFVKDLYSYGNVGIGTDNPQYMLDVRGTAHFCEVRVKSLGWCDYVFADDYQLPDLQELERFIKQNRHLPGIPTEAEVLENGVNLGEMNMKLLEKIEELTLIIIEQNKRLIDYNKRLTKLELSE